MSAEMIEVCTVRAVDCHFFFFNDTATTEIYTLSLHDALPICGRGRDRREGSQDRHLPGLRGGRPARKQDRLGGQDHAPPEDRKSTRLNSSHANISYAVFCLKKKKKMSDYHLIPHCLTTRAIDA